MYRGLYRSKPVAVKSMVLPVSMSGAEMHECMAIVEAAISRSLSHPNIVSTYTYSLKSPSRSERRPLLWPPTSGT
jgi:hypothetical protein